MSLDRRGKRPMLCAACALPLGLVAVQAAAQGVETACPEPRASKNAFDLFWTGSDYNGFARQPRWCSEKWTGKPPDPVDKKTCGGFPEKDGLPQGKPQCTTQTNNESVNVPEKTWVSLHRKACKVEARISLRGHLNWVPALYAGTAQ